MSTFWKKLEKLSPEKRFTFSLKSLPDKLLLQELALRRGRGRNDYPLQTLWSSLLKSLHYDFPNFEKMRKQANEPLPPPHSLSRFISRLIEQSSHLEHMQKTLVDQLHQKLPAFGHLITMGEMIIDAPSFAKNETSRRSARGADMGEKLLYDVQTKRHQRVKWHGYRLHYILDTKTALPLLTKVTPASEPSLSVMYYLLESLKKRHPTLFKECCYALGDATYDDEALIQTLWKTYHIKPLIKLLPTRSCSPFSKLNKKANVVYNDLGEIFCTHPRSKEKRSMIYAGFEEKRNCLKYRCMASSYDFVCKANKHCIAKKGVRVSLNTNQRLFTPVARSSYKWDTLHKQLSTRIYYENYLKKTLIPKLPFSRGLEKLQLFSNLIENLLLAEHVSYTSATARTGASDP